MTAANELYSEHAELYAQIADDRDFGFELRKMGALEFREGTVFVELFAGPAFHSVNLGELGYPGEIIAVDTSPAMERVARKCGFQDNYLCTDAIAGLRTIQRADIICVPRYSIVLVDDSYVTDLFTQVRESLDGQGAFFVEIHKDAVFSTEAPFRADWESLSIHRRTCHIPGGTAECVWPSATKVVDVEKNVVELSIHVRVTMDTGQQYEQTFQSIEHLHTSDRLEQLATDVGLAPLHSRHFDTASGRYLAFGRAARKIVHAEVKVPTAGAKPRVSPQLLDLAMSRIFDLSTEATRAQLVERSGLNVEVHDSPLSRHVYNLL